MVPNSHSPRPRSLSQRVLVAVPALLAAALLWHGAQAGPDAANAGPAGPAQASHRLELIGQIGGRAGAPVIVGSLVVAGVGPRLIVVDIADPASPRQVGQSEPLGGVLHGIDVEGNRAYVVTQEDGGFQILDLGEPRRPTLLGATQVGSVALDVVAKGDRAYVATLSEQVLVLDVSDPAAPSVIDVVAVAGGTRSLHLAGDRLYAAGTEGLSILDVGSRDTPVLLGAIALGDSTGVDVADGRAYVIVGQNSLAIIDVRDARAPRLEATLALTSGPIDVAVAGGLARVATAANGLALVDVTSPPAPRLLAQHRFGGGATGLAALGDMTVATEQEGGLRLVDTRAPATPQDIGALRLPGGVESVRGQAGAGFVYGREWRSRRTLGFDLREPSSPTLGFAWSTADLGFTPQDHFASGGRLYLAGGDLGVAEVGDPSRPGLPAGRLRLASGSSAVTAAGDLALVVDDDLREPHLVVIDASDPNAPRTLSRIPLPGLGLRVIRRIVAAEGFAYIAAAEVPVVVVDIRDPASPIAVANLNAPEVQDVYVQAGRAYIASSSEGLIIVDVATPSAPVERGRLALGRMFRVSVSGSVAFLGGQPENRGPWAVTAVDLSDPAAPHKLAVRDTAAFLSDLWADGDRVFVAEQNGGLVIQQLSAIATPTPSPSATMTESPSPSPTATPAATAPASRVYLPRLENEEAPVP